MVDSVLGDELIPGYRAVSFHIGLTLGADFATTLDRSIRLLGPDNIRYLADEPVVEPSLLAKSGSDLDGWVTFLLPTDMNGPATMHITIDPKALTEIVIPVVIGGGKAQPPGDFAPTPIVESAPDSAVRG